MTQAATSAFLDASDELDTVADLLDLLGMAHRGSNRTTDSDGSAVHAGVMAAMEHLDKAKDLLDLLRPALGMPTREQAMAYNPNDDIDALQKP
ncbi:hypothetical protein GC209_14355 [bacterium]|nr:hypothetical protein [bacterium]